MCDVVTKGVVYTASRDSFPLVSKEKAAVEMRWTNARFRRYLRFVNANARSERGAVSPNENIRSFVRSFEKRRCVGFAR